MESSISFEEQAMEDWRKVTPELPEPKSASFSLQLQWPTDYRVITQGFGTNPELYLDRGLPGHEGLDIRAPMNAKVYACADGVVEHVQERIVEGDPYGRWARIRHGEGYSTLYGHLGKISVARGSRVKAGQVIGLAGPTGETGGGHIHLGLTQSGATAAGATHYADDILDPTPFFFAGAQSHNAVSFPWPLGHCLRGQTVNAGEAVVPSNIEAIKLGISADQGLIRSLRKQVPNLFLMTELHLTATETSWEPSEWVARVRPALQKHIEAGIAYFGIQRAPNLAAGGWTQGWQSGHEFGRWWIDVVALLKERFPQAKFGFPSLASGPQVPGQRMEADVFMEQADEALLAADWIAVQAYWQDRSNMEDENGGARHQLMRRWYPDKLLFITEGGNVDALTA